MNCFNYKTKGYIAKDYIKPYKPNQIYKINKEGPKTKLYKVLFNFNLGKNKT